MESLSKSGVVIEKTAQNTRLILLPTIALLSVFIADAAPAQMYADSAHSGPTMNFHRVDDRLATGGHFVDGGMAKLQQEGVKVVIDLRDKPPSGQKKKLAALGIEWINIPVV